MANTTNLSLGKLAGTENLKNYPTVQSDNMDKIDQAVGAGFGSTRNVGGVTDALADAIAILANGNTHAAITSGQYVYVKNHASLTEGLYVATTNIAANATLSGSNLTADSSGGLNAALASAKSYTDGLIGTVPSGNTVEGQITSLSNQIGTIYEYPAGLTTIIGLASNAYIGSGKEKTYSADNSVITTLTDWPSALASYKFCAIIKIQRTTLNIYIYQVTAISGGGIPKTVYGYALSGSVIWDT